MWRRPGLLVLTDRNNQQFAAAERKLKSNSCVIRMFLTAERKEAFLVSQKGKAISPNFHSLSELCGWVIINIED